MTFLIFTLLLSVFSGTVEINEVRGQSNALFIDGNTLFCGNGPDLVILDVTAPLSPKVISTCPLAGLIRQIVVRDGIAYVTGREAGLWVVDVRNKTAPRLLCRYDTIELATGLDLAGNVLFISHRQNGVEMVDVTDPSHPQHIRVEKTEESQSCIWKDGILYSGEWAKGNVTVVQASDMADIKTVRRVKLGGFGDGLYIKGKYLFAATGGHKVFTDDEHPYFLPQLKKTDEGYGEGHGMEIYDISVPTDPVFVSRVDFKPFFHSDYWTVRVSGDGKTAFCADNIGGVYAIDVSNPQRPRITGHYDTPSDGKRNKVASSIAVGNGVLYVTVYRHGLVALKCRKAVPDPIDRSKGPVNTSYRYPYSLSDGSRFKFWKPEGNVPVRSVAAYGNRLYAACSSGGLAVLGSGPDGTPELIGKGPQSFVEDVKVWDDILFAAEGNDGLGIYRIGEGSSLEEIGRLGTSSEIPMVQWVMALDGKHIAVSPRFGGWFFADVSELSRPRIVYHHKSCPGWDKYICTQSVSGKVSYIAGNHGFGWIDLSTGTPVYTKLNGEARMTDGVCPFANGKCLLCAGGKFIYMNPGDDINYESENAVRVTAISREAGSAPKTVKIEGIPVWDGGTKVGVNHRMGRYLSMVDVSNPLSPVLLWEEHIDGLPETGIFWEGRYTVAAGYQGIMIER